MQVTLTLLEKVLGKQVDGYGEPTFDCPFCRLRGRKKRGHIHVNLSKDVAICHSCDYRTRSLFNLINHIGGKFARRLSRERLSSGLVNAVNSILSVTEDKKKKRTKVVLPEEAIPLTLPPKGLIAEKCYEYLRGRGLRDRHIDTYNIYFAKEGLFEGMLIFPVFMGGSLVFFTSRRVLDFGGPKSLHAKNTGGAKSGIVFNFDNATRAKRIFICEGPFDAWSWPRSLGRGVSVMGHVLHEAQARALASIDTVKEFVVCFDSDCHDATKNAASFMERFTDAKVSFILLKEGDPNDNIDNLKKVFKTRKKCSFRSLISEKFLS